MKKAFFFFVIFFALITMLVSFIVKKNTALDLSKANPAVIECGPPELHSYDNIEIFKTSPYHVSKTRNNVFDLSADDLDKIAKAIKKMKALPKSNPLSWDFQVAIHGGDNSKKIFWGQCQHENDYFLSWHRMYLYFFEKILRSQMPGYDHSKPALPYWNYQKANQAIIHPRFYTPAQKTSNPLYNPNRNSSLNIAGGSLYGFMFKGDGNNVIDNQLTDALKRKDFFNFQDELEVPHQSIHKNLGGDMADAAKASNDPLFFLHHANIDRLWQKWLNMGEGRCNPTLADNPEWWNQVFVFYDVVKNNKNKYVPKPVKMYGWQIMDMGDSLHYKYDNVADIKASTLTGNRTTSLSERKKTITVFSAGVVINRKLTKTKLKSIAVANTNFLQRKPIKVIKPDQPDSSNKRTYLEFENVQVNINPNGVIEVYINPKNNNKEDLNYKSPYFAGLMNLFLADINHNHGEKSDVKNTSKLEITNVVNRLGLSDKDLEQLDIVFVLRGNYFNGKELPTEADVTIEHILVTTYF